MKKIFTLIACAFMAINVSAQEIQNEDIVILSKVTIDSLASDATSNQTYIFDASCKGITMSMAGRAQSYQKRQNYSTGLNFKKGSNYTINLPEGIGMYGIQFAGYSQGDNWNYLGAYGPDASAWEWTETACADDKTSVFIKDHAKYPIDPCEVNRADERFVDETLFPALHLSGYTFASIDFTDEPYTGTFTFFFEGNNQQRAHIRIFTSKAAWQTYAEQCAAIQYTGEESDGISNINVNKSENNVMYNIAGQRVNNAKGLVIMNGKKVMF